MAEPRKRWIVRRPAMALIGVVLLSVGYVGSVLMIMFLTAVFGAPTNLTVWDGMHTYMYPVSWYSSHDEMPGAKALNDAILWSVRVGIRVRGR